jgi:hypothetical protein
MVRQWIHKPRLPKQLELFVFVHIAQSPVQYLAYTTTRFIKAYYQQTN